MINIESLALGLVIFIFIILIIALVLTILEISAKWKLFKKAGKNGWEAIVPYYNTWTLVEISGCKWWFFLLIICSSLISFNISLDINETSSINYNALEFIGSIINVFALYMVNYNIAMKCEKSIGYAIGLTLLPFIFYPMLGFGDGKFNNNINVSPYGAIKGGEK